MTMLIKSREALSDKLRTKQREMRQVLKRLARPATDSAQRTRLRDLLDNLYDQIDELQKQIQTMNN